MVEQSGGLSIKSDFRPETVSIIPGYSVIVSYAFYIIFKFLSLKLITLWFGVLLTIVRFSFCSPGVVAACLCFWSAAKKCCLLENDGEI